MLATGTAVPVAAQDSPPTVGAAQPGRNRDLPLDAARNITIDTDEGSNPLENIRDVNTIRRVMKNGRLYDGNTLDEVWQRRKKMDAVPGIPD